MDEQDLLDAACAAGAVVVVEGFRQVGGRGTPVGRTWPLNGTPLTPPDQQRLDDRVRPDLADLLDTAVAQARRYGEDAPEVLARISVLLREVGWQARDEEHRQAVSDQLERLRKTIAGQDFGEAEAAELDRLNARVDEALDGQW